MSRLPVSAEKKIYGVDWAEAKKSMTRSARRRAFVEYHATRIYDLAYELDQNLWISAPKFFEIWSHIEGIGYFQFSQPAIEKFVNSLSRKEILVASKEVLGRGEARKKRNFYRKYAKPLFFSGMTGKLDDVSAGNFHFDREIHEFVLNKPSNESSIK
ncbi:uncharacterized protein METZ01_LOCUS351623 [marine metagenome]|uniref:Uncharacterized protein n=1 Tax=marine metagenome TaxID=408172 RepID=A0A382RM60_9ZZZZ